VRLHFSVQKLEEKAILPTRRRARSLFFGVRRQRPL